MNVNGDVPTGVVNWANDKGADSVTEKDGKFTVKFTGKTTFSLRKPSKRFNAVLHMRDDMLVVNLYEN